MHRFRTLEARIHIPSAHGIHDSCSSAERGREGPVVVIGMPPKSDGPQHGSGRCSPSQDGAMLATMIGRQSELRGVSLLSSLSDATAALSIVRESALVAGGSRRRALGIAGSTAGSRVPLP